MLELLKETYEANSKGKKTLIFNNGDCLAVKVVTASSYTHVGAVVVEQGSAYVYESAHGIGVFSKFGAAATDTSDTPIRPVRPTRTHLRFSLPATVLTPRLAMTANRPLIETA